MSASLAKLMVFLGKQFACVKIVGRANFTSSIDFKALLNGLRQKGYEYFVLDLSECVLMDSTFLGVLAGFGLKMCGSASEPVCPGIELRNPNPRVIELLESLGVLHLFRLVEGALAPPPEIQACTPAPLHPTREEVARAALEAHQTLMSLSPENAAKFKDVAQFLADDLRRLHEESAPGAPSVPPTPAPGGSTGS